MGAALATHGFAVARQAWALWRGHRLWWLFSVRTYVVTLILAVLTPLLAFCAFLVLRTAAHEQDVMGSIVRERARAAAATVDHELANLRPRLFLLASSPYLRADDFTQFRKQAEEAFSQDGLGIILSDTAGRAILGTVPGAGEALVTPDVEAVRRVVTSGAPDVSNLQRGTDGAQHIFLNVPVMREGRLVYVLGLDVSPLLPRLLAELDLPPDWLVAFADAAGYTIARSREADRFVGQLGRPAVLQRFQSADEGWFPLVSRDGVPVYNAFAHARFAGWVVSVGIPDDVLYAPVRHSTRFLLLAVAVAVAFAVLLGLAIGRRLSCAITGLVGYAEGVGRGEHVDLPSTGVTETDAVARSLHLASERLQQSAQERAVLLQRTVTAQEAERKRIARELHDSLGQYLTVLRLGFTAIEPHCASDPVAQRRLGELKALASTLGRELSRISWELRPTALDDLGLQQAVTQYLEVWAERSKLNIDLEIKLDHRRLPQPVETALFRALQEAISNVMKHSGADRVGVILRATKDEVKLIVEDDGRGFAMPDGPDGREFGMQHLGLIGVRERLALVHGSVEVESSPQDGTTIYVRIPL